MRNIVRLFLLLFATLFASGAYAQLPKAVGLSETDNILTQQGITKENAAEHFWMNQPAYNIVPDDYASLVDGDLESFIESNWEAYVEPNYLYVYLNEKVGGPIVAYIQRRSNKTNNHVTVMTVFGSNDESAKAEVTDKGWDEIATVNVSNPGSDQAGLTDIFTPAKPYKYFRFRTDATDNPNRQWSFHMAEFGLYSLNENQAAFINLAKANSRYEIYLTSEPGEGIGTGYYQYSDRASFERFRETLEKIHDIVINKKSVSTTEANTLLDTLNADWQKVQDSHVLYQVPEAGYYRIEFVYKPGYCAFSNFMYGRAFVGKIDANDSRQLWYMEPAGPGKTLAVCAADGSFPVLATGSSTMCFTPRIYTRYVEGNKETNDFSTLACSFDAIKATDQATGLPIVAMRPPSAPNYVEDATKKDDYGSYVSYNKHDAIGNTDDCYSSENEVWTNEATQVVLVRVPDAEAKKIIEASSYTAYAQLQEKIEEANDILDIAADAENCFTNDFNGQLLANKGDIASEGGFAPRGYHSIEVDLGAKVEGGVNVRIEYSWEKDYTPNPVEWRVYGSNDNKEWTLLDPCYNSEFINKYTKCATLPLNLGKGYQYLRFVCRLSWSTDDWCWHENSYNINLRIHKAKRLSKAQIENEASQTLLKAVQAALAKTGADAAQADVDALQAAIDQYKLGFADPTALRQLLAKTQYLAAGVTDEFGAAWYDPEPGYFTEAMDAEFGAAWYEANTYANSGVYSQEQLEVFIEMLTVLKAEVEDAAIKVKTDQFYFRRMYIFPWIACFAA